MSTTIRCIRVFSILAVCGLAASARASSVVRVGGGSPFTTLQSGVNAAADGDVVLVANGFYGDVTISGKGVSIVEDAGATAQGQRIVIDDVPAGSTVLISGVDFAGPNGAMSATDVLGALRVQNSSLRSFPSGFTSFTAVILTDVADASFAGCTIQGSADFLGSSRAMFVTRSKIALDRTTVLGGPGAAPWSFGPGAWGGGGSGADAISGTDTTVFARAGAIRGGNGSNGHNGSCTDPSNNTTQGGHGGDGVELSGASELKLLDAVVAGGTPGTGGVAQPCGTTTANGNPGQPVVGSPSTVIAGDARALATNAVAREGQNLALHVEGLPGDRVILLV